MQDALLKSNEVFETFKQEIEKVVLLSHDMKVLYLKMNWCLSKHVFDLFTSDGKIDEGPEKRKYFLEEQMREIRLYSYRTR